jgi:formylglycine-generating enzyme required for sulfatase activity
VGYYYDDTHAVGKKLPNELGIFDMSGNVEEWCSDWYGSYGSNPVTNPQGANQGDYRVLRGGSSLAGPQFCRASDRNWGSPDFGHYYFGFRLVLSSSSPGK